MILERNLLDFFMNFLSHFIDKKKKGKEGRMINDKAEIKPMVS
jgi:hypothetical protein